MHRVSLLLMVLVSVTGCASWSQDTGVENRWRGADAPGWTAGETTVDDVLKALGPPSQIISLGDELVYYYLRENLSGSGVVLILYNRVNMETRYDRAIFFFDRSGHLTRYAYSAEALAREN